MYIDYYKEQVALFEQSDIFKKLKSCVEKTNYHLKYETGFLIEDKKKHYFIHLSIIDDKQEMVKTIYDDEEEWLCAYGDIVVVKKEKVQYYFKWNDSDFIESIEWLISVLEKREGFKFTH